MPTLLVDMAAWWTRPPLRCVKTNAHADATPSDMPSIYAAVGRHWRLPYVSLQQAPEIARRSARKSVHEQHAYPCGSSRRAAPAARGGEGASSTGAPGARRSSRLRK